MRETQAIVERIRRVSPDVQQIDLAIDQALTQLQPGQSVYARLQDNTTWDPYLREQWIPVDLKANTLTIEMTPTRVYEPGQILSLLSPVGKAFPVRPNRRHVLLIADDALPTPLMWLARVLVANGVAVTLVLGGAATAYPLELLPREIELQRSDTGWTWPEQVETLNWADQVLVLAPPHRQAEVYGQVYETINQIRQQLVPDDYVCGVFYLPLACGTGACQACEIPGSKAGTLACADGPAIDLRQVKLQ